MATPPLPPSEPKAVWQPADIMAFFRGPEAQVRLDDLVIYCRQHCRMMRWCNSPSGKMPQGFLPEDLVQEVIFKAIAHDRKIPLHISINSGLRQIIRSTISHLAESPSNVLYVRARDGEEVTDEGEDFEPLEIVDTIWNLDAALSPLDQTMNEELMDRLEKFCGKDAVIKAMLNLWRTEHLTKPAEVIAQRIGVSVGEIYQARRRLSTCVREFDKLPI